MGFGPVQTGSQSVWDQTSPTLLAMTYQSMKSVGLFSSSVPTAMVVANPTDALAPDPPASKTAVNEDEGVHDEFPKDDYEAEVCHCCINLMLLMRGQCFRSLRMM